jgi:hypothetical protein
VTEYFPMVAAERQGSYAELSRLRLTGRRLQKAVRWRGPAVTGIVPATPSHRGALKAYRRGQIMIDRGISFFTRELRGQQPETPRAHSRPRGLAPRLGTWARGSHCPIGLRQAGLPSADGNTSLSAASRSTGRPTLATTS